MPQSVINAEKTESVKNPIQEVAYPDPYHEVEWLKRTATITNDKGEVVFEQENVEAPASWSQLAVNVTANKFFRGDPGTPEREYSIKQVIDRVINTIVTWGDKQKYFANEDARTRFCIAMKRHMMSQTGCFNSPVLFNFGTHDKPQASACFILSVKDSIESIYDWIRQEGLIFKYGSGSGINISPLRGQNESLSYGGKASGPLSFMKIGDCGASVVKSGGKNRRAAKLICMNADHPDILEFIRCKSIEEKKADALVAAGYSHEDAYATVQYQMANHSIRATDKFMKAVEKDGDWMLVNRNDKATRKVKARSVMWAGTESAHSCGDPGFQFDTTTNEWHTTPKAGRQNASNPCGEFVYIDDSSCNLASLNLLKFWNGTTFNALYFASVVDEFVMAQDILVSEAHYPTDKIKENSINYRPIGLGFGNIGSLIMRNGWAYDSDEGRCLAASIAALMTFEAYLQSSRMARDVGPYFEFEKHRKDHRRILVKHNEALSDLLDNVNALPESARKKILPIVEKAVSTAELAIEMFDQYGVRNAQVTLLAPMGTIGFLLDVDTTGIEPEMALVRYKNLVGGGQIKLVNQQVQATLETLGYTTDEIVRIIAYIAEKGTIEGSDVKEQHLPVFDCSLKPDAGKRAIEPMGHVKMMAAVQPFLSSAISKTVNMPNDATKEDVYNVFMNAWKMGCKSITVYRDGCKGDQPVSTSADNGKPARKDTVPATTRRKLPTERPSITHKFSVGGYKGYVNVGLYDDGKPGEMFVTMSKEGSVVSGLMDAFATAISINLQYGVPVQTLINKFSHMRFEPNGFTGNPEIPIAKSIVDYIFRWMDLRFGDGASLRSKEKSIAEDVTIADVSSMPLDAPLCPVCGSLMQRSGACHRCPNCGGTSGCS